MTDIITPSAESAPVGKWQGRLQRWSLPFRVVWLVAVIGFCVWKLNDIGWGNAWRGLPRNAWFYVLFALSFMVVPAAERVIFGIIWQQRVPQAPLYRKRALNNMVLGYSGDLYFYLWCVARLPIPARRLLSGIKDSSVLSSIVGTLCTVLLVVGMLFEGKQGLLRAIAGGQARTWIVLGIVAVLVIPLIVIFRRRIFGIDGRRALLVFAIHFLRAWVGLALQILQWWVILPAVPLGTWWLLVTVQALINQLPLVPNGELLFLALSLQFADKAGVDQAAFVGLMVGTALVRQVANMGSLFVTSFMRAPPEAKREAPAG